MSWRSRLNVLIMSVFKTSSLWSEKKRYKVMWRPGQADRDSTHSSPRNTGMEISWYTIAKPIFIPGFGMINRFDTTTDGEVASVALIAHTTIWTLFLRHHLASRFLIQRKTAVGDVAEADGLTHRVLPWRLDLILVERVLLSGDFGFWHNNASRWVLWMYSQDINNQKHSWSIYMSGISTECSMDT